MRTIFKSNCFDLAVNTDKQLMSYLFHDKANCLLTPNSSDELHGSMLALTALDHKVIHELTHHYIAKILGFDCCPIVWAEAHKTPFPENAGYLEDIIFSMVYFIMEKKPLFNDWYSFLDRLYNIADIFELKTTILKRYDSFKLGEQTILL